MSGSVGGVSSEVTEMKIKTEMVEALRAAGVRTEDELREAIRKTGPVDLFLALAPAGKNEVKKAS